MAKTAAPDAIPTSALLPPFHRSPESKRFRSGLDDVSAVGNPIEQRLTESGVRKDRRPLREWQVGCHDQRRSLSSIRDHLEQKLCPDISEWNIADFIQGDQISLHPTSHQSANPAVLFGLHQFIDQRRSGGKSENRGEYTLVHGATVAQFWRF